MNRCATRSGGCSKGASESRKPLTDVAPKMLSSQVDSRQTSLRGTARPTLGQVGCPAAAQALNNSGVSTGQRSTQQRGQTVLRPSMQGYCCSGAVPCCQ